MLIDLIKQIGSGSVNFQVVMAHLAAILMVIFLILPVHEFAHAGMAYLLGDKNIIKRGRLSLNPLAHIDILGALCMLVFGFGWAKPVPINPQRFDRPRLYTAICAIAGPLANILCGMLGGILYLIIFKNNPEFVLTNAGRIVFMFLQYYVIINATLAVFNLIPIPPLDGSKVLFMFLPADIERRISQYQQLFTIVIFALLYMGTLDGILDKGVSFVVDLCVLFQN